jgi:hypothetical protein
MGGRDITTNFASIVQFSAWQLNGTYYTGTFYFHPSIGYGSYLGGFAFGTATGTGLTQRIETSGWSAAQDIYYTYTAMYT